MRGRREALMDWLSTSDGVLVDGDVLMAEIDATSKQIEDEYAEWHALADVAEEEWP